MRGRMPIREVMRAREGRGRIAVRCVVVACAAALAMAGGSAVVVAEPSSPDADGYYPRPAPYPDPLGLREQGLEAISPESIEQDLRDGIVGRGDRIDLDPNNYAQDCPDVLVVAITGATDSSSDRNPLDEEDRLPWSNWVGNVTVPAGQANAEYPGRVGWVYVPYASEYGIGIETPNPTYQDSVREGMASTTRLMEENKTKCGERTKYVMFGYSVGAEVVQRLAVDIGSRPDDAFITADDIAGIALVGDPYRPVGTPSLGEPGPEGGGFMSSDQKDYGTLTDKIQWACRPVDIACAAPERLGVLPMALNVLGQVHFTLFDPGTTVTGLADASSALAARTVAYVFANPEFATSEESVLDVMVRLSDQTTPTPEDPAPTPDEVADALRWATGPGRDVIAAKIDAEIVGFDEDNRDIPQLWEKPYLELGFLQHLYYWDNFPDNGRDWESEKMIRWISDLAREQSERNDAEPTTVEPTTVEPAPTEPTASTTSDAEPGDRPRVIPPVNPGYLAPPAPETETVPYSWEEFLRSVGIPAIPGA